MLPKTFKETGGILATRRNFVTETSRLGLNIALIEISREESVEINTYEDWWIANNYLNKIKIAFVVDAYTRLEQVICTAVCQWHQNLYSMT
ncbi:MAG: hypothetical protein V8S94_05320 [Methanobrevibacter smithii]